MKTQPEALRLADWLFDNVQHINHAEAAARAEAERLATKSQSRNSRIRVLMQVDVLEPKYRHAWRSET